MPHTKHRNPKHAHEPAPARPAPKAPAAPPVTDETVRVAAYHKWEAAGRPISDGVEFWLRAEREVR